MANKKRIEENWEVIAVKRMWTLIPMTLYVLFGLFCILAIINTDEHYIVVIVGAVIDCFAIPLFVSKLLQPKEMILYDRIRGKLKFVKWRKELEVYCMDIKSIYCNSFRAGSVLVVKAKDGRKIILHGIAKVDDVDSKLNDIIGAK